MPLHRLAARLFSRARHAPAAARMLFEEIEPRILYSADLAPGLSDAGLGAEIRLIRSYSTTPETDAAQHQQSREILFVDATLPGLETLLDELRSTHPAAAIHLLAADEDGLLQISEVLAGLRDLDAIHILTHGEPGSLQLGNTRLDTERLGSDAPQLQAWGKALNAEADLLLYGCDLAASAEGKALVQQLALLTGADVAASTNLTGHASLGGDWVLEYRHGSIESQLLGAGGVQEVWLGVLENTAPTLNNGADLVLDPVLPNAPAPSGAVGTLVSSLVDLTIPSGGINNVTDPDPGALTGIAIRATDSTNGNWYYSLDNGTTWQTMPAVNVNNALLLAADNSTRVYFQPNAGFGGSATITFRAWDQTSGVAGGLGNTGLNAGSYAFSNASDTARVDVTSAPVVTIARSGYAATEDSPLALHDTGIKVGDADSALLTLDFSTASSGSRFQVDVGSTGVTILAGNGSTSLSLSGSVAQLNALLAGAGGASLSLTETASISSTSLNISASDGTLTSSASKPVSITQVNDAPLLANPVADQNATKGQAFSFTVPADTFSDEEGDPLTWSASGLPAWLSFDAASRTFSGTPGNGQTGSHSITLSVTDTALASASTSFTLTVADANLFAPQIVSNGGGTSASLALAENTSLVTTVQATDADLPAQSLSYSISGGADAALFVIDSASGELRFVTAPDYENPQGAAGNRYEVIVSASDGSLSASQTLTINITDVNEFALGPITDVDPAADAVAENAPNGSLVGITARAVDADGSNSSVSYALADDAGGRFTIDPASGVLRVADGSLLDFEAAASHQITILATSADGSSSSLQLQINLIDLNEAPSLSTPASLSGLQGQPLAIPGISLADPEGNISAANLQVSQGQLTITLAPGASIIGGSNDSASLTLSGSQSAIQATLDSLSYTGGSDFSGTDLLTLTVSDSEGLASSASISLQLAAITPLPPDDIPPDPPAEVPEAELPPLPSQPASPDAPPSGLPPAPGLPTGPASTPPAELPVSQPATGADETMAMQARREIPALIRVAADEGASNTRDPFGPLGSQASLLALLEQLRLGSAGNRGDESLPGLSVAMPSPASQLDELLRLAPAQAGIVAAATLSAGTVLWASRSAGLIAALIASAPAWRSFDPLPIVARSNPQRSTDTPAEAPAAPPGIAARSLLTELSP